MRTSKALAKIRAGKPVKMCVLGHFMPAYVRLAAHNGFDCIWLDLEHREWDAREVQAMLAYFHLFDIDCLLRTPTREKSKLYRFLEDGATGLMVPLVSTEAEAKSLVDSVKFPPLGQRGLDGAGLDADYAIGGGVGFTEAANRETFLVVQIETPEAVENVDKIAAVPGVDGMFVGPGDLGLRLRVAQQPPFDLAEAIRRVAAAAKKHGKAWGMPAMTAENLRELTAQGAQLANWGSEFGAIRSMFEKSVADWKAAIE